MQTGRLKLVLWNMVGLTGVTGGMQYSLLPYRFLFGSPKKVKKNIIDSLERLVEEEQPDILFLTEVYADQEIRAVLGEYEFSRMDSKYMGEGVLGHVPFMRDKDCNAFFMRRDLPYSLHKMHSGTKKLLYSIDIAEDLSLILGHFALTRRARKMQFAEVAQLCTGKKLIVAGDLNIFGGTEELAELLQKRDLKVLASKPTFPAVHPRYALDTVVIPRDHEGTVRVRGDIRASDHLPIVCEIIMPL